MIRKLFFAFLILCNLVVFAQQSYYSDVNLNLNGLALKNELATKISNTHTRTLDYRQAKQALKIIDLQPAQTTNVLLLYGFINENCQTSTSNSKNHKLRNKEDFVSGGGGTCKWNREHTFPKSLGSPNLGNSGPGADAHHLRASDVRKNSNRGNKKFSAGNGNSGISNNGWYPGDEWKGDVARMIMYMYLRYGNQCLPKNVTIGTQNTVDTNMINLLLEWNAQDPVSKYEDNRNTYLGNVNNQYGQGNRNPFIDNPYLATRIWGGIAAQDRWGNNPSDNEAPTAPTNVLVTNTTSSSVTLSWSASSDNIGVVNYEIFVNGISKLLVNSLTATISELVPDTSYSFYIKAKDATGNSSIKSNITNAKTLKSTGNTGEICVQETFEKMGASSSSYRTRSWTGDKNFVWTATDARTDLSLNGRAITIRNGKLIASQITGGISSFTVKTKRVFGGGSGTFNININGEKVGVINYSSKEKVNTINNINIAGNITISLTNNSSSSNRVIFDDISWKCYKASASVKEVSKLFEGITVHPNPSPTGNFYIKVPTNVEISSIKIFSVLGKKIYQNNKVRNLDTIKIKSLNSGIYLLKISNNTQSIVKNIVVE